MNKNTSRINDLENIEEIYKIYQFNPVEHKINKKEQLRRLNQQRESLFKDHLNLPLEIFKNKSLLEFGAASGEKSLIYSLWKAKITCVEPNKKFTSQLKENFQKYNRSCKIINKRIENYNTSKVYDFVIMENFLSSIKLRKKYLDKSCKFIKNGGYLIFNYHNPIGFFSEYIKYFILRYYLDKKKIYSIRKSIIVAKKFLFKSFKKIKHTRSFDKYVLDQFLINNFLDKTLWNPNEIFKIMNKNNLRFYSSYPAYKKPNSDWHKIIMSNKIYNNKILKNYTNLEKYFVNENKTLNQQELKVIKEVYPVLIRVIKNFNKSKEIIKILKKKSNKESNYLNTLLKVFKNINPKNYNKYHSKIGWGYPNHYLVFRKN